MVIRSSPSGSSSTKEGRRGVDTRTIGRDLELLKIQQTFEDVVDEGSPRVITIVGDAGVGKSRLLLSSIGGWPRSPSLFGGFGAGHHRRRRTSPTRCCAR